MNHPTPDRHSEARSWPKNLSFFFFCVLDAAMHSEPLASIVDENYHVVHVNIDEGKSNSDLADRFQIPLDKGVPSLAVIDGSGQLITSQK